MVEKARTGRGGGVDAPGIQVPRVLGVVEGHLPGPTLICVGGMHGNEPAGVVALQRVLPAIEALSPVMRGRFAALVGNRQALRAGRRFRDRDLNRAWSAARVANLRASSNGEARAEDREQLELLEAIDDLAGRADGPVRVLDLHTTSGAGGVFTTVSDTLPNRAFAMRIPVPLILGLEELVDGTLLEYLGDCGFIAAVFESGQHEEPAAVERAEAGVWVAVEAAGLVSENAMAAFGPSHKRLLVDTRHLPRVLEMRHRHPVEPGDGFEMEPGYENFQRVAEGEMIAYDDGGPIASPETARILMPLYQEQGDDGFFVVREFGTFWLHLSALLRRLGLASFVHWLPGIREDPELPGALIVDRRVARWYAIQILHLFGFRKQEERGDRLVVKRRCFAERPATSPDPKRPGRT